MSEASLVSVRRRWTAGRVARWVAGALAGIVLLLVAIVLGLNTAPGRSFLVGRANGYQTASGLGVHIGRIEGSLYGRMLIRDLRVSDAQGTFLTSPAVVLDWRPFKYVRSIIDVREASAGTITLLRTPVLKPTPSDPNAPLLPDIDLTVAKLRVDRFVIEPAVDGKRHIVALAGTAAIADRRAQIAARAAAIVAPGVAGGDRVTIKLDAVPDSNRFDVDAQLRAPAGGLIDSYAGLGKPIAASIEGAGDWRNWKGRVSAQAGGEPLAGLDVQGRNGRFRVTGALRPGVVLAGPAARLAEPRIALDLDATLGERKVDLTLQAGSSAFALQASGLLDLGASRFAGLRINGKLLKPGAIADNVVGRDVVFTVGLDGPFATPTVDYRLAAGAIGFGTTGVQGLVAAGRATVDADRILVPVHASARAVTGVNAAAGGLLTNVRIDGDLAYAGGKLLSDNLRLRSDRIDATAVVIADVAHGTYTGALKGRVNDYQVAGLGRINLVTDAHLVPGAGGGFGIRGRVRVETRRIDNAGVRSFLGGNALITADVGFDPGGAATLSNLRVAAPDFRVVDGRGSYRLADGRIAFEGRAVSRAYGPVSVTTAGTVANPVVHLRASRPGLGVGLADVDATLTGSAAGYRVKARGGSQYGPFAADLVVRAGAGPLALDVSSAQFAGVGVRGRIVQTAGGPFAGALALSGSGLNGSVRLAAAGANQRADVDARMSGFRVPGSQPITIGTGIVRASATMLPGGVSATGDVSLGGVAYGTSTVSRARARFSYAGGRGRVQLVAAGQAGLPFDVAAQAAIAPDRIVANVRGTANTIPFRLAAPALVTRAGAEWVLAPATLVLPQGQAVVGGRFGARTELNARLDRLDLAIAQAFAPGLGLGGRASGTISYAQAGSAVPQARARIDIARFTRTSAATVSEPVDVALLATLSESGGDARAVIRRGGATVGRFQARLAPLAGGAGDAWSERLLSAPLSGGIRYNGPADVLWTLGGLSGQTLTGPIAVGADFGGRLDQPTLTGTIRADALRYENEVYGTVLSSVGVRGRFTQSRFELQQLTAKAGDGTVRAQGFVGLDSAGGFPMNLQATLDHAQLARSDALGATVSGTVAVTNGRGAGGLIKGDLRLPEVRYQIVRQGAAEVPELTGVRRKGAPPPGTAAAQASALPSQWKLDIRVRADNKLFVSGMGLESEWKADLRVGGTSTTPQVTGKLEIVRGTYSFAGRRFDVSKGDVEFDGGQLTNPVIAIAADTTVEGVTATINISGRAQNPQIAFTSTPSLPQDEVLSRLLFGSSITNLSPSQAIQLAAALNSLRGSGGGGLNPLGKLRSATGIDRLRVLGADKTAGRGTALAAGQYISNDIYVEVITDARGFTATQIEIAISKALSILSSTGSFGGSSVQLRYSKDY